MFGSMVAAKAASKFANASMKLAVDRNSLPGFSRSGSYSITRENTPASDRSGGDKYSIVLKAIGVSPAAKTAVNDPRESAIGQPQPRVALILPTQVEDKA